MEYLDIVAKMSVYVTKAGRVACAWLKPRL